MAEAWRALVYFWDGGWLGVGDSGDTPVPPHSHHAVQISIGLNGPVWVGEGDGERREFAAVAIEPDVTHSFEGRGNKVVMLFVEPESHAGRWVRASLREPVAAVPAERIEPFLPKLRRFEDDLPDVAEATELITGLVRAACAGPPPRASSDERIHKALAVIHAGDARNLSLDDVAREVFLSPSRFAHLFSEEMGLPFRRYLLWRKVNLALGAFGRGGTLSAAAHEAGFADSAHLTRTFHQMFGLPPSIMMGGAKFYEIPSPFMTSG